MGAVVAASLALLVAPATVPAEVYSGGTDQPGGRKVHLSIPERGSIKSATIEFIADCRGGGAVRSRLVIKDFNRSSRAQFARHYSGNLKVGGESLKTRYSFVGKQEDRNSYFGTLRLSGRFTGRDKPRKGACRTNLVRWRARIPHELLR